MDPYEAREASGLTHQSVNSVPNTLASPRVAFGMAMVKSGYISRGVLFTQDARQALLMGGATK